MFRDMRAQTYDAFCPTKIGYACQHSVDLYDEVATIARPPVEPLSKRPLTDLTGYIICLYRVFKGDDGEKFERNWLYWTGIFILMSSKDGNVIFHHNASSPNTQIRSITVRPMRLG